MNTYIDISDTMLTTERIILRPCKPSDLDDFYNYASVDGVGQMAGWKPHENKRESARILNIFIEGKKTFALIYEGHMIGTVGIEKYDENRLPEFADKSCRELGFVLSKEYWGRGIMPEAVRAVIKYLFEEINLDIIVCGHFLWNKQSQRVQEKCGFKHYSYGEYKAQYNTVEQDELTIITREDWKAQYIE